MRIVIIGTGLAGQLLLRHLRQIGCDGHIVMFTKHSGDFYSKPSLSNVWQQNKTPDDLVIMPISEVESQFQCQIIQEEVIRIDNISRHVFTKDGQYPYDKLVLATGAGWIDLAILPEHPKVFRVNHLDDYRKFYAAIHKKSSVAVIGGGLIGVEFAYDLSKHCHQVSVIEKMPHLMGSMVPREVGEYLKKGLESRGVDVYTETEIQAIKAKGEHLSIITSRAEINVDVIVAAVGLRSEIDLAKSAGLKVSEAIDVNQYGQTSDPHIYALGDCAKVCGMVKRFVAPLRICSQAVGSHILGIQNPIHYPPMPVLVKTPDMPVCLCYNSLPEKWDIKMDENGIEALAYHRGRLCGFVLAGDRVAQRVELKNQIKPWL